MKLFLSAAALALTPSLALAQAAPVAGEAAPKAATVVAVDPARLAMARQVAAKLLPTGTYKEMMGASFGDMMDTMMGSMGDDMPLTDIMTLGGLDATQAKALGDVRIREIMALYDPNWEERSRAMVGAMSTVMGDVMEKFEPTAREALAQSYAREFTLPELTEMDRFFSTPAGARYASKSMILSMSPEMMKALADLMPELMKEMPAIMEAMAKVEQGLPQPRKIKDLPAADRKRLADLLGVAEKDLVDPNETTELEQELEKLD